MLLWVILLITFSCQKRVFSVNNIYIDLKTLFNWASQLRFLACERSFPFKCGLILYLNVLSSFDLRLFVLLYLKETKNVVKRQILTKFISEKEMNDVILLQKIQIFIENVHFVWSKKMIPPTIFSCNKSWVLKTFF